MPGNLSAVIKEAMDRAGFGLKECADAAQVSRVLITRLLNSEPVPRKTEDEEIRRVAHVLQLDYGLLKELVEEVQKVARDEKAEQFVDPWLVRDSHSRR